MVAMMAPIMPSPAQLINSPQSQYHTPPITESRSPRTLAAVGLSTRSSISSPPSAQLDGKSEQSVSPPDSIPKMEPFSRTRISRRMKEQSLLQKAEQGLTDRCMSLEGDEGFKCWEALFEFENLKEEFEGECELASEEDRSSACRPLERFENLVRQSGGVSSLIDNVRMVAFANKKVAEHEEAEKMGSGDVSEHEEAEKLGIGDVSATRPSNDDEAESSGGELARAESSRLELDGLPKTEEELDLEQSALMPESPLTRMLRRRGPSAKAW